MKFTALTYTAIIAVIGAKNQPLAAMIGGGSGR